MKLDFTNIAVLNFPLAFKTPDLTAWGKAANLLTLESCFRITWMGHKDDLKGAPLGPLGLCPKDTKLMYVGLDAYKFILSVLSGIDSKSPGDTQITGTFRGAWERLQANDWKRAKDVETMIQYIFQDTKIIRTFLTSGLYNLRHEIAAKALLKPEKEDSVLLITDSPDKFTSVSDKLLEFIFNKEKAKGPQLGLMDITVDQPEKLLQHAHNKRANGRIVRTVSIEGVSTQDLERALEQYDHIVLDVHMGRNQDFLSRLLGGWQNRKRADNKLMSLKGDISNQGVSPDDWLQASRARDDLFVVEDIREKLIALGESNAKIIAQARTLIDAIIEERSQGGYISVSKLKQRGFNLDTAAPATP